MEKLIITKAAAQAILVYLAKKPYEEVFQILPGILNLDSYIEPVQPKLATTVEELTKDLE